MVRSLLLKYYSKHNTFKKVTGFYLGMFRIGTYTFSEYVDLIESFSFQDFEVKRPHGERKEETRTNQRRHLQDESRGPVTVDVGSRDFEPLTPGLRRLFFVNWATKGQKIIKSPKSPSESCAN